MKASRLLSLLLLLQTRPRMTTTELAERLEVSRRTVLRDVEALSAAGVPVYTQRGRLGGIALLPGARLNASHLEPGEVEALSLTGLDHLGLQQLGMAAAAEQAAHKLAAHQARIPDEATVASLSEVVLADSAGWRRPAGEVDVAELALDVRTRQRLEVCYRRSGAVTPVPVVVNPYGLVSKAGRWYLVADADDVPRMFAVERITSYEVLDQAARLPPGRTLAAVWTELAAQVEQTGDVLVQVRLRRSRVDLAARILGSRIIEIQPLDEQWSHVRIRYGQVEDVRQLLQFGDHIEVLAPDRARQRVHDLARDVADRHAFALVG